MKLAIKRIKSGLDITETQISAEYDSSSSFKNVLSRLLGTVTTLEKHSTVLKAHWVATPLGSMIAIADEKALYLLEFVNSSGLERKIERLRIKTKSAVISGYTQPIKMIENELNHYFNGKLKEFNTPLFFNGSAFQKIVWEELKKIPYGEIRSYSNVAIAIGKPSAFRAVAQANGANQFPLIIPCHRVININGELGGYSGGIERKKWLINHEKKILIKKIDF